MLDFDIGIAAVDRLAKGEAAAKVEIGKAGEGGLQRCEPFGRRFGPGKLLMVERDAAVGIQNWHHRLIETAFPDRAIGALLADERERVERLAADAFHRRDGVAASALVLLRVKLVETVVSDR